MLAITFDANEQQQKFLTNLAEAKGVMLHEAVVACVEAARTRVEHNRIPKLVYFLYELMVKHMSVGKVADLVYAAKAGNGLPEWEEILKLAQKFEEVLSR